MTKDKNNRLPPHLSFLIPKGVPMRQHGDTQPNPVYELFNYGQPEQIERSETEPTGLSNKPLGFEDNPTQGLITLPGGKKLIKYTDAWTLLANAVYKDLPPDLHPYEAFRLAQSQHIQGMEDAFRLGRLKVYYLSRVPLGANAKSTELWGSFVKVEDFIDYAGEVGVVVVVVVQSSNFTELSKNDERNQALQELVDGGLDWRARSNDDIKELLRSKYPHLFSTSDVAKDWLESTDRDSSRFPKKACGRKRKGAF